MKGLRFAAFLLFFTGSAGQPLLAQSACDYRLELFDSGGDGWDGAMLTVSVDGNPESITLEDGQRRVLPLAVSGGSTLQLGFEAGGSDPEIRYALFDAEGGLVFSDGPMPAIGPNVFSGTAACPTCPAPSSRTIRTADVRAFRADISWVPPDPAARYEVEFDTAGFALGSGQVVPGDEGRARLEGLQERTSYEFYVYGICGAQDTSTIQGPYSFRTRWANDVGIEAILGPLSDCDLLPTDTITVALANFGGLPQTLIPYRYSVNQIDGGVPIPFDGLYTGVLGKDSVETIDFETTFDFSAPGEYEITAWTELEGDSNIGNDTAVFRLTSIPTISTFPYFTDFESGASAWTVARDSRFPTWEYGQPAGLVIRTAAGGNGAWVSNLSGPYQADERSYLLSPCLDFSGLTEDPELAFELFLDLEDEQDRLLVEMSLDGGESWSTVGQAGTGLNWYNGQSGDYFTGSRPWTKVSATLDGAAGEPEARLRFSLLADNSLEREGVGVDNISIANRYVRDLAALEVTYLGAGQECSLIDDQVLLRIANLGTETQSGFSVSYRIDGGAQVVESTGSLSVDPGQEVEYLFQTPFSTPGFGTFPLVAAVSLNADEFPANDQARTSITTARRLPFTEDFEGGSLPAGWEADDGILVTDGHGNLSQVLAFNLSATDPALAATTPAFGPLVATDTLTFDYRYVLRSGDGSLPVDLVPGDSLKVQVSINCGQDYSTLRTIDAGNHTASVGFQTIAVPLSSFDGSTIKVRLAATHGAEDYWLDIDNINVRRCPPDLALRPLAQDVSGIGQADGVASVEAGAGSPPFRYAWSTGATGRTQRGLLPDTYTVIVTDDLGCLDSVEVAVGILTSSREVPSLFESVQLAPNPSPGPTRLLAVFRQPVRTQVQVMDLMGRVVWALTPARTDRLDQPVDLTGLPPGLYLVRIRADDQVYTEKLLLGNGP